MLAAVQRDHLSGHRRGVKDEADGSSDLLRGGAAPEDGGFALRLELRLGLVRVSQHRPRPDGIDAHARSQRLRQGTCGAPQGLLGGCVGEVSRGWLPYALVDDIYDISG